MTAACKSAEFRKKVDIPKKVACDFHNADKGKYHKEDIDMDELNRIKKLAGISEKVELMADKNDEVKDAKAEDVTKAMQMAKLKRKMEDRDSDSMDFNGLFTGVAKGEIRLDDNGKIAESNFGILKALEEACGKRHSKKKMTEGDEVYPGDEITDDNIDLDRVVSDPAYRERVKAFLNAKHAHDTNRQDLTEEWVCGQCGNKDIGFMDTMCNKCGASNEYFKHPREDEFTYDDDDVEESSSSEKKKGRRVAGSYGRPGSEYQKRQAAKATRRSGKEEIKKGKQEVDENDYEDDLDHIVPGERKWLGNRRVAVAVTVSGVDKKSGKVSVVHDNGDVEWVGPEKLFSMNNKMSAVNEKAPKGWEGTVKAMKKDSDIDNPWALAHWMKKKGYKSHKKEGIEETVEVFDTIKNKVVKKFKSRDEATMWAGSHDKTGTYKVRSPNDNDVVKERDMFSESTMFAKDSLARLMVEMIIDEMKTGKTAEEISEELCFNIDNVKFVVEHFKKKVAEGYTIMPPIDRERYTDMSDQGLEGPFTLRSGKVVYYDPKEGKYYDRDSDMYMSQDEFNQHDERHDAVKETGLPGYDAWKTASPYDNEPSDTEVEKALEYGEEYGMDYLHNDSMAKALVADIKDPNTDPSDRRGMFSDLMGDVGGTIVNRLEDDGNMILSNDEVKDLARMVIKKHFQMMR